MKSLITVAFVLVCFASHANAINPSNLVKREDANPPYIIESYSCDLSKLQRREDGSTFGPIERSPVNVALAVKPETYEALLIAATREWLNYMGKDPEIQQMKVKVKKFENEGNIAAMKHWNEKLQNTSTYKEAYFRHSTILKFISEEISQRAVARYYKPSSGVKQYSSFDEMDSDYTSYCNFGLPR